MAGFLVVAMGLFFMGIVFLGGIYLLYSYILESIFRMDACTTLGIGARWQAWVPFYGQYLLGKMVGKDTLGILVMLAHIAAITMSVWFLDHPGKHIWYCLLLTVLLGFIGKTQISAQIFRNWAGNWAKIYSVVSIVTLGVVRPIFLFVLRKKVCMFSKNT